MSCVHRPVDNGAGGAAFLLWGDEAQTDGEQIGICVCIRCGAVFAGLFVERAVPTPEEGALRYVGPFTGRKSVSPVRCENCGRPHDGTGMAELIDGDSTWTCVDCLAPPEVQSIADYIQFQARQATQLPGVESKFMAMLTRGRDILCLYRDRDLYYLISRRSAWKPIPIRPDPDSEQGFSITGDASPVLLDSALRVWLVETLRLAQATPSREGSAS